MKYVVLFVLAFVLSCGAMPKVDRDALICDTACAVAGDALDADRCVALCDHVKKTRAGQRVCVDACKAALEVGVRQCRPACVDLMK